MARGVPDPGGGNLSLSSLISSHCFAISSLSLIRRFGMVGARLIWLGLACSEGAGEDIEESETKGTATATTTMRVIAPPPQQGPQHRPTNAR